MVGKLLPCPKHTEPFLIQGLRGRHVLRGRRKGHFQNGGPHLKGGDTGDYMGEHCRGYRVIQGDTRSLDLVHGGYGEGGMLCYMVCFGKLHISKTAQEDLKKSSYNPSQRLQADGLNTE